MSIIIYKLDTHPSGHAIIVAEAVCPCGWESTRRLSELAELRRDIAHHRNARWN